MADINNEKLAGSNTTGADTPTVSSDGNGELVSQPKGKPWMYKKLKLGFITIPYYASPAFQVGFVAIVCFLTPGMFNAVNGLGAAGQVSAHDINNANTALYSTFAGVGFFCGSIANRIGLRFTLAIGGFGYFFYICSILSYNHNGNVGFLIFAGALLGLCAAMLWTAQGAVMMSYPPEKSKGKYIAWFWMIFNLGAVIGGLVSYGLPNAAIDIANCCRFRWVRIFTPRRTQSTTGHTLLSSVSWPSALSLPLSSATLPLFSEMTAHALSS